MQEIILIIFTISLLYVAISNRLRGFINILAFQGLCLFALAFVQLSEINPVNLVFILVETIVFKTLAMPMFLRYLINRNKISRETEPSVSFFVSLLIVTALIVCSFLLVQQIEEFNFNIFFFVTALSTLFTGMYIIITRKNIISHVMGYLIMENGVFILSLAVGSEMPMLVNTGILLDIFISVLVFGIFVNRLGNAFEEMSVENLQNLRD